MNRDLTCNETMSVDDADRAKDSAVRRYQQQQAQAQFRPLAFQSTSAASAQPKFSVQKTPVRAGFQQVAPSSSPKIVTNSTQVAGTSGAALNQGFQRTVLQPGQSSQKLLYKPYFTNDAQLPAVPASASASTTTSSPNLLSNYSAYLKKSQEAHLQAQLNQQILSQSRLTVPQTAVINNLRLNQTPSHSQSALLNAVYARELHKETASSAAPPPAASVPVRTPAIPSTSRPSSAYNPPPVTSKPHLNGNIAYSPKPQPTMMQSFGMSGVQHVQPLSHPVAPSVPLAQPQPINSLSSVITPNMQMQSQLNQLNQLGAQINALNAHLAAGGLSHNLLAAAAAQQQQQQQQHQPMVLPTSSSSGIQQVSANVPMATPSPRPSILRKRADLTSGSPSAAKRRLPFMEHDRPASGNGVMTTPGTPTRDLIRNNISAPPHGLLDTNEHSNDGNHVEHNGETESPRKRMRKQQFDSNQPAEQIKMEIPVIPTLPPLPMTALEKKRRGRPRGDSRPSTAIDHSIHATTSIVVDVDRPAFKGVRSKKIRKKDDGAMILNAMSAPRAGACSVPPSLDIVRKGTPLPELLARMKEEKKEQKKVKKAKRSAALNKSRAKLSPEEEMTEDVASFLAAGSKKAKNEIGLERKIRELGGDHSMMAHQIFPAGSRGCHSPLSFLSAPSTHSIAAGLDSVDARAIHFEKPEQFSAAYDRVKQLRKLARKKRHQERQQETNARLAAKEMLRCGERTLSSFRSRVGAGEAGALSKKQEADLLAALQDMLIARIRRYKEEMISAAEERGVRETQKKAHQLLDVVDTLEREVKKEQEEDGGVVVVEEKRVEEAEQQDVKPCVGGVFHYSDEVVIDDLVDEMCSFVADQEAQSSGHGKQQRRGNVVSCAERRLTRQVTRRPILAGRLVHAKRVWQARRAHTNNHPSFRSLLSSPSRPTCGVRELSRPERESGEAELIPGRETTAQPWWPAVCGAKSKHVKRSRRRERRLSPDDDDDVEVVDERVGESKRDYGLRLKSEESVCRAMIQELLQYDEKDLLRIRLAALDRQVEEQYSLEARLLEWFVHVCQVFDPQAHDDLLLDMERDADDDDSDDSLAQKRLKRLRQFVLRAPITRMEQRRPEFGDNAQNVFNAPDQIVVNRFLGAQSPFWRGAPVCGNHRRTYISRYGRRVHERDLDYWPLKDHQPELYTEDVAEMLVDPRYDDYMAALSEGMSKIDFEKRIELASLLPASSGVKKVKEEEEEEERKDHRRVEKESSNEPEIVDVKQSPFKKERCPAVCSELRRRGANMREMVATCVQAVHTTCLLLHQARDELLLAATLLP